MPVKRSRFSVETENRDLFIFPDKGMATASPHCGKFSKKIRLGIDIPGGFYYNLLCEKYEKYDWT